jgi:8-amino-7-oxononanoate synthase
MPNLNLDRFSEKLQQRAEQGNLRKLSLPNGGIDFFSNDYLGLAHNLELAQKIAQAYHNQGFIGNGATGSRLLSGNSLLAQQVEQQLATFFRAEAALLFNSGFVANSALLATITSKNDTILYDSLIHASLHEGCQLSFANTWAFRHNDLAELEKKLQLANKKNQENAAQKGNIFVVIESVYSMDGDTSLLVAIVQLCENYQAYLIIDEAHSTGIFGQHGNGLACEMGLENKFLARVYTFGKAMGVQGACVVGSQILVDYLLNFAKGFIYTTALPPHNLVSIACAFDYLLDNEDLIYNLQQKIQHYQTCFAPLQSKFDVSTNNSPIQIIKIAGNAKCKLIAEKLQKLGFDLRAILSPTVAQGEERLRICLHTYNTKEEIEFLAKQVCLLLG